MKTVIFIILNVLFLFCLLFKIGNGIFEAMLVTSVVSIIIWLSYVCCENSKIVIATFYSLLLELILYYLYELYYLEEGCFVEQLGLVIKWSCFNFALAIIVRFIPRIKKICTFFWINGIVSPILFLYITSQIS